jgi:G3E family GTPase
MELARERKFEYILIESSGISEPLPVAETFTFEDAKGNGTQTHARDTHTESESVCFFLQSIASASCGVCVASFSGHL